MAKEINLVGNVESMPVASVPGDTLRVLVQPAHTEDEELLPTGTEYRPVSAGIEDGRYVRRVRLA